LPTAALIEPKGVQAPCLRTRGRTMMSDLCLIRLISHLWSRPLCAATLVAPQKLIPALKNLVHFFFNCEDNISGGARPCTTALAGEPC